MSIFDVQCPNCGSGMVLDLEKDTRCNNCFFDLSLIGYVCAKLESVGYSTIPKYKGTKNRTPGITLAFGKKHLGEIDFYPDEDKCVVEVNSIENIKNLLNVLAITKLKLYVLMTGIEPRHGQCPICDSHLSYQEFYSFNLPQPYFVGCKKDTHNFAYSDFLIWLGGALSYRYPKYQFVQTASGLTVRSIKETNIKPSIFKIATTVKETISHGSIKYVRSVGQVAIWVPKSLLPGVLDIATYLESLKIANVRVIKTNE